MYIGKVSVGTNNESLTSSKFDVYELIRFLEIDYRYFGHLYRNFPKLKMDINEILYVLAQVLEIANCKEIVESACDIMKCKLCQIKSHYKGICQLLNFVNQLLFLSVYQNEC